MIRQLENVDPSNYDKTHVMEFIQKVSPFTETNQRLLYLIEDFLNNDMESTITVSTNETEIDPNTKENKIKMFMLWYNNNTVYSGTAFVRESEMTKGIEFSRYEPE